MSDSNIDLRDYTSRNMTIEINDEPEDFQIRKSRSLDVPITSYGVACCRKSPSGEWQILLVQRRNTYAYCEFVKGAYGAGRPEAINNAVMALLNHMTPDEKFEILSLDFDRMYYRMTMLTTRPPKFYLWESTFKATFLIDGGVRLRKLIGKSMNGHRSWEIPKGRKNLNEHSVNCAVREFWEETQIPKDAYKLIPEVQYVYSFADGGVRYRYIYYLGIASGKTARQTQLFNISQFTEINDIQWLSLAQIKLVDHSGRLGKLTRRIFDDARSYS